MSDAVNLEAAHIVAGADVRLWPITTLISQIAFRHDGFGFVFDKLDGPARWPDVVPDGWTGPVQYTIFAGALVRDTWEFAAILNVWYGLPVIGGTALLPEQFSTNLWYLNPALAEHVPAEGESIAYFVAAGGLRGVSAISVRERSQVVVVPFGREARTVTFAPPPAPEPPVSEPTAPAPPTAPAAPSAPPPPTPPPPKGKKSVLAYVSSAVAGLLFWLVKRRNR